MGIFLNDDLREIMEGNQYLSGKKTNPTRKELRLSSSGYQEEIEKPAAKEIYLLKECIKGLEQKCRQAIERNATDSEIDFVKLHAVN